MEYKLEMGTNPLQHKQIEMSQKRTQTKKKMERFIEHENSFIFEMVRFFLSSMLQPGTSEMWTVR